VSETQLAEIMTGLEPGQLELVPHDGNWSELAASELERIRLACPERIIECEHIGSTSIEHLMARPVLDLLIGVQEMMHSGETIQPLKAIGYRCHGEQGVPGRRLFTLARENRCLVHVHLYRVGSPLWEAAIGFRDHLRNDVDCAKAFDQLRRDCIQSDPGDLDAYEKAKRAFEAQVVA
tara:strand:+ start:1856 stop:2389 length:534 start_codon:yes stop_codon:yes gene_type:complete